MKDQTKAYLLAFSAVLCWSAASSAFKLSLRYLSVIELLFFSSCTACLVLLLIILLKRKFHIIRSYGLRDYRQALFLGLLNPFFYYLILLKAYSLLPGQIAQPLNFIWPIMIVLFSIPMLKQKIRFQSLLAILISFGGVVVISTRGNFHRMQVDDPRGVFLALFSSIIWALFFVISTGDKRDTECQLFFSFLFGSVFAALLYLPQISQPHIYGILGAIYVGVFEMGVAFVLWIKALKLSRTTAQVSNLVYLTPFLALIILRILVGEVILPSTVIGIILVITGIVYQRRSGVKL